MTQYHFNQRTYGMRCTLLAAMALVLGPVAAFSQEFPLSFNGLLKKGDLVGYQSLEQGYRLSIASKEAYEMHLRGAAEDDDVMIETEPHVAAAVKAALDRRKPPRDGYRYQSERPTLRWTASFKKVLFVGNDYVILSKVGSDEPHQALKFARITSIGWLSKDPSLYTSSALRKIAANEMGKTPDHDKYFGYAKRIIGRYDDNKDGHLVSAEWGKMLMSPAPADANKDGRISVAEYAQMLSDRSSKAKRK